MTASVLKQDPDTQKVQELAIYSGKTQHALQNRTTVNKQFTPKVKGNTTHSSLFSLFFYNFLRFVIVLVSLADIWCHLDNCKTSLILLIKCDKTLNQKEKEQEN